MQFYIKYGNVQDGPFDLVTMIRKIRNKEISRETLVLEEKDSYAVAAYEHPRLQSFYEEMKEDFVEEGLEPYFTGNGFVYALQKGWSFFQHYPNCVLFSSGFLFVVLLMGALFSGLLPDFLGIFLGWTVFHFLNGAVLLAMKQLNTHHRVDFQSITTRYLGHLKPLLLYSITIAFLSAIGGIFLVIPALFLLTLYIFAPLLILEENYSFWDAMETSKQTVIQHGRKLFEILFGLTVVNFVAALFFLLPLAITIPITYIVIIDLYDKTPFHR